MPLGVKSTTRIINSVGEELYPSAYTLEGTQGHPLKETVTYRKKPNTTFEIPLEYKSTVIFMMRQWMRIRRGRCERWPDGLEAEAYRKGERILKDLEGEG